jgi:hypothetical protein
MNPSTDIEILSYLRSNAANLSYFIPASKSFTNRIRNYEKHLDNTFKYLLSYKCDNRTWIRNVKHFLESLYIPSNDSYNLLEKMYVEKTGEQINRGIIGEPSNFVEEKPDECHVCCKEFSSNDKHLSCGHWICKSCIINSAKECCPLCRKVVSLTSVELKLLKQKRNIEFIERRQVISNDISMEHFIEYCINNYLQTTNPMHLRLLYTWCNLFERTVGLEEVNRNPTYILARELMNENAGRF